MGDVIHKITEVIDVQDRTRSAFASISRSYKKAAADSAQVKKETERINRAIAKLSKDPSFTNIGRQFYKIGASANRIGKLTGISSAIKQIRNVAGQAADHFKQVAKYAAFAAAAGGVALAKKALEESSSYAENLNRFKEVFQEQSDANERWAESTAKAMRRSKADMIEYMAIMQDTFVPMGFATEEAAGLSRQLSSLSVDVASFKNKLDKDALLAFQSAIVGNHEALRSMGIIITQASLDQELLNLGFKEGAQKASEQLKALARVTLVLKSTARAQGDAERTADSYTNTVKRAESALKELYIAIGQKLEPLMQPMIEQLSEWMEANKGIISADVAGWIGKVIEVGKDLADTLIDILKGAVEFAHENPRLAKTIGGVTAALIALNMTGLTPSLSTIGTLITKLPAMRTAIAGSVPMLSRLKGLPAGGAGVAGIGSTALGVGAAAIGGWSLGSWLTDNTWIGPLGRAKNNLAAANERFDSPEIRKIRAENEQERLKHYADEAKLAADLARAEVVREAMSRAKAESEKLATAEMEKQKQLLEDQKRTLSEQLYFMDPVKRMRTINDARRLQGASGGELANLGTGMRDAIAENSILQRIFSERAKETGALGKYDAIAGELQSYMDPKAGERLGKAAADAIKKVEDNAIAKLYEEVGEEGMKAEFYRILVS